MDFETLITMTHIDSICAWYYRNTHTTITYSIEHHPCTQIVLGVAQQQRHGEAAATEHLLCLLVRRQLHAIHLRGKGSTLYFSNTNIVPRKESILLNAYVLSQEDFKNRRKFLSPKTY